jgi:hypothetical protein
MEGSDILNVGECPTVVQEKEKAVFLEACEFIWARALRAEGITDGTLKVTMTQASVDQLYHSVRRDLCRMLGRYEPGLLSCPELFFMVVNHFYHSESGREFRLPLGAAPVHRRNKKGRVSVVLQGTGEFHGNKWLNSLMLCLLNMSGMAGTAAWLPIFVTVPVIQQAMMNMRRRQLEQTLIWRNAGWCYRRVFYGALFALLAEEMVDGEVFRYAGGRGARHAIVEDWHVDAQFVAVSLGFLSQAVPSLGCLSRVRLCMGVRRAMSLDEFSDLLTILPRFLENPTALLEKMWYMADYWRLMRHCCYCRYGASWKKPTTFWIANFSWEDPLMCTKNGEQCDARKMNDGVHPVRLGGDSNHSMADKWHVPFDLCMDLLRRMKKQRPYGRWFLTLFGGAGSFDRPCAAMGLLHVSVSYDRPTSVDSDSGSIHVFVDLLDFSLFDVLHKIWVLTGLHGSDLVGCGAHPGCESFSLLSCQYGGRDTSEEGWYLAQCEEAMLGDEIAHNAATNLFPNMEGSFMAEHMSD